MTVNWKNYLIVWGILLCAWLAWSVAYWNFLPHLPDTYSGEPVYGKVVDSTTARPIAGAIVIGLYELSAPYSMEGGIIASHMHVEEVITDAEGNYHLAAWGPKPRYGDVYLINDGPIILIYKNGYELYTNNTSFPDNRFSPIQTSFNTGETIELKQFQGDLQFYTEHMSWIPIVLDTLLDPMLGARDCAWKATPRIMLELDRLVQATREKGIRVSGIPDIEYLVTDGNCGTREDFIRRYANEIMDDNQPGNRSTN